MPEPASLHTAEIQILDAGSNKIVTDATAVFAAAEELLRLRQIPRAIEAYHTAEGLGSDADACAGARWVCFMLLGDYSSAWRESDRIEGRGKPDPNRFWTGEPLDGRRVMVRCLHGLGDTLQYVRYLPLLRERAAQVILEAQPGLKELLAFSCVADHVTTWSEPEPPWDAQVEIVELPRIFRTSCASIPQNIPYISAPRANLALSSRTLHVGFVWTAGAYNPSRSIPLNLMSALFDTPRCEFFSLQAGEERAQLAAYRTDVRSLEGPESRPLKTASNMLALDLLITVDTMTAHLAGALGVPVWTLLPFEADWRWMLDRADSPWYPTMRLFRQPRPGDWASVVRQLREELIQVSARAA